MKLVYTLKELNEMPTIHVGHMDNLKVEKEGYRVWLSRMTVSDGMPYDNQVTIEVNDNGRWITIVQYEATNDVQEILDQIEQRF